MYTENKHSLMHYPLVHLFYHLVVLFLILHFFSSLFPLRIVDSQQMRHCNLLNANKNKNINNNNNNRRKKNVSYHYYIIIINNYIIIEEYILKTTFK